jgi:hypothetical protein
VSIPPSLKKAWPHLRAALVLFHFACIFVLAFPAPIGGLDRAVWKLPAVQEDFQAWARALHMSEPVFEDLIFDIATGWMTARGIAARPFETYTAWTGTDQPWRMFVGPVRAPTRLQIQVHGRTAPPDAWETLFEERSTQYRWHELLFTQERLRSQISRWPWPAYSGEYDWGCAYIARLAFDERPDIDAARCRFVAQQSPTVEQVRSHVELPVSYLDVREHQRPVVAGAAP